MTGRTTLVACIGNELVADDAVGYHIFAALQESTLPAGVRLTYCGVGGVALLELLQEGDAGLIVVDAVQFGSAPGTLHRLDWEELPPVSEHAVSAHGIGLKDTIAIGRTLYPERMPAQVVLIGIEGRCFDQLGGAMTAEVAAALPAAVEMIRRELDRYADIGGKA